MAADPVACGSLFLLFLSAAAVAEATIPAAATMADGAAAD